MAKPTARCVLVLSALACVLGGVAAAQAVPREHPYLFFTKQDIPAIRERLKDPEIARMFARVRAVALDPPREPRQGNNVLCGGLAYALTGDRAYAEPALRTIDRLVKDPRSWRAHGNGLKVLRPEHGHQDRAPRLRLRPALRRHDRAAARGRPPDAAHEGLRQLPGGAGHPRHAARPVHRPRRARGVVEQLLLQLEPVGQRGHRPGGAGDAGRRAGIRPGTREGPRVAPLYAPRV